MFQRFQKEICNGMRDPEFSQQSCPGKTGVEAMRRVLIAAYYFPPMASVSWMRVTKFAKYLPQVGWSPIVVTVDGGYYPRTVPGPAPADVQSLEVRRFAYRFWLPTLVAKLIFPLYIFWNAWKGRRDLHAVVLCGSPFHPYLIAPLLRFVIGLPVVLDLRDGWSTVHAQTDAGRLRSVINPLRRLIETIGFRNACAAVFATEILKQQYQRCVNLPKEGCFTVTNGFDPDDFESVGQGGDDSRNIVLLAGKFLYYTPQVARWLFDALAEYPDWQFLYIGEESEAVMALARQAHAQSRVQAIGYLPYQQVLREVGRAGLCVTTNSYPEGLGTKIFDYLALHKRVLCFVPAQSEIANQFEGVPGVTVCREPHSRETVLAGLERALGSASVCAQSVAAFTREQKALELARVLDRCAADGGPCGE